MVLIWCIFYLLYFSIGQREISYQHVVLTQGRTRYMKLFELKVWNQAKKHCKESEPSAFSIGSMQNLRLSFAFLKEFQYSAMRGSSFWSHSLSWFPAVRRDGITNKNAESKLLKSIPCFGIYRVSQKKCIHCLIKRTLQNKQEFWQNDIFQFTNGWLRFWYIIWKVWCKCGRDIQV